MKYTLKYICKPFLESFFLFFFYAISFSMLFQKNKITSYEITYKIQGCKSNHRAISFSIDKFVFADLGFPGFLEFCMLELETLYVS